MRRRTLAVAFAAALVAAAATTGHAAETVVGEACDRVQRAVHQAGADTTVPLPCRDVDALVEPILGGGGFPPAGFAVTAVTWSMGPGATSPAFTGPSPATSHPANWACDTSYPSLTTARAECWPTDPPDPGTSGWACYDPFVDVTITGPALSDVNGTSSCGTSVASCTASTGLVGAGHCNNWAFPHQPVPLVCEADFSAVVPGSSWTVRCAPIDP